MNADETTEACLKEMFCRVGERYSRRFCKQDDWFRRRSWTDAQCDDFSDWMVAFLRRRERWTKKTAEKEAGWFLLMYGWSRPPDGCLFVERKGRK